MDAITRIRMCDKQVDHAFEQRSEAIRAAYPKGTIVRVTKGRSTFEGVVESYPWGSYPDIVIRNIKTNKLRRIDVIYYMPVIIAKAEGKEAN